MNKVWIFFEKNAYLLLFLLLQSIALSRVIRHNYFQSYLWFTASNYAVGNLHKMVFDIREYFSLKSQNQILQRENATLRNALNTELLPETNNKGFVNDTVRKQVYIYQEANVLYSTYNLQNNYMIINRGSVHGIKPGMAIITPFGVAGITKDVDTHYSTALTVLHSKFSISCRPINSYNFGSLTWNGKNYRYAQLIDLPKQTHIRNGDTVVTDVRSLIFPEGIPVGIVKSYRLRDPGDFIEAQVELFTDFSSINQVYVIDFLEKKAIENLKLLINENK
ncbi:cell shape-determining protein MreC [Thermaurantimonas aggregans]|uniref:Cell shape-determining protein MreC n=1 Tax=Thermaurantimonas aggregans TaxID=2173829 RepID=A0A401XMW5_9FLAO|nr:rod shape-determining protein MreC [Thermaurantimonas aggregans]MCX8148138.1 rod shape-determining protein MreC [Thermaurantimonas aggregans]GCD78365.1 cell shape-determining protein MreC [Thermaurantimonas aggregans]